MKKFLLSMVAAGMVFGANAATYVFEDELVTTDCTGSQSAKVTLTEAEDGTYSLELDSWTCMTSYLTGIGKVTMEGLTASEEGGITTLTGEGNASYAQGTNPDVMMWFCSYCPSAPTTVSVKFNANNCYMEIATEMNIYGMAYPYSAVFGTDEFEAVVEGNVYTFEDELVTEGCAGSQTAKVTLTEAEDGTCSLELDSWTCMTSYMTGIGKVTMEGLTMSEEGGVKTLVGEGNASYVQGTNPDVMMWFCAYCPSAPTTVTVKFNEDKCYMEIATEMNIYGMAYPYSAVFGTDDFVTTGVRGLEAARQGVCYDLQGRMAKEAKGMMIKDGKVMIVK